MGWECFAKYEFRHTAVYTLSVDKQKTLHDTQVRKKREKTNGVFVSEALQEELGQAALTTSQAYAVAKQLSAGDDPAALPSGGALEEMLSEKLDRQRDRDDATKLSTKILVIQPVLRFLQLLCENHNRDLQVSLFL